MVARGGSYEPRAEKKTTCVGASPPIITTIRMSADAAPSDGAALMLNQPNPITLASTDQPKPPNFILLIAASPIRSPTIPLPSNLMASEEFDRVESFRHEELEQPTATVHHESLPTVNEVLEANEVEEVVVAQPIIKRVTRKM